MSSDAYEGPEHFTRRMSAAPPLNPYAQRRFGSLGDWEVAGFRLKAYGINATTDQSISLFSAEVIDAARSHAKERLSAAHREGGHYGLGYVILHAGIEANWLLVDWWAHGDIACHLLSSAPTKTAAVFNFVSRPLMACVWELVLITHERNAWVRHMLKPLPDPAGYIADRLPDGLY